MVNQLNFINNHTSAYFELRTIAFIVFTVVHLSLIRHTLILLTLVSSVVGGLDKRGNLSLKPLFIRFFLLTFGGEKLEVGTLNFFVNFIDLLFIV